MPASTGRLFLGFWSLSLGNLPIGQIQHRLIDVATAGSLIRAAREAGTLRCGSSEDLVAPYGAQEARRHARLCAALSRLGIPVALDDFLNTDEEGVTTAFPLGIVPLGQGDRLLIVDCGYQMKESPTGSFEDRFEIVDDSITFHLFEPGFGSSLYDLAVANDSKGAASVDGVPLAEPTIVIGPGAAESGDGGRANEAGDLESALVPLDQADTLSYPCIACACFDYYATGEGRTIGLLMMSAASAAELVQAVDGAFGEYFAADTQVSIWRGVPPGFEALDPRMALDALDAIFTKRPGYQYSATLHYNAA